MWISRSRRLLVMAVVVGALLVSMLVGVSVGPVRLPVGVVWRILLSGPGGEGPMTEAAHAMIVWQIRLPRVILGVLIGCALAVAGVIFQGLFRNPMADPYVIGVSSGAALGATVAIVSRVGFSVMGLGAAPLLAFVGGVASSAVVYRVARVGDRVPAMSFLLAGAAVGCLFSSVVSLIMVLSVHDTQKILYWLMGGLGARGWDHVRGCAPYVLLGLAVAALYSRELNAVLLGEETAQHLGIDIERFKGVMGLTGSLLTGSAVAVGGVIGFVGLVVPHAVRMLLGPDHRLLVPASAAAGGTIVVCADMLARTVVAPAELPVGVVTSLVGVPFFLYLLRREKGSIFGRM